MANPWIFRQIEDAMHGRPIFEPTLADKRAILHEYFDMLREDMPETPAINRMKQLAGQFTRGLQGGALFRTSIYHSHTVEEVLDRIEEYFEAIESGRPTTAKRRSDRDADEHGNHGLQFLHFVRDHRRRIAFCRDRYSDRSRLHSATSPAFTWRRRVAFQCSRALSLLL
jgi:hypothetical protein